MPRRDIEIVMAGHVIFALEDIQKESSGYRYRKAIVSPAITMLTIDISLMRMLSDGPEVSLNGSPTVSPTMVSLWFSLPLPPKFPSSIIFLALSHAPPEFDMNTARVKPAASPPVSNPSTPATPNTKPTTIGITMASSDGIIISR